MDRSHPPRVDHHHDQAHADGEHQVCCACTGKRYEAESAAQNRGDAGQTSLPRGAFNAKQINAAVEIGEHRQQDGNLGDHLKKRGCGAALGIECSDEEHQPRHLTGSQNEAFARHAPMIEFPIDFGKVPVSGSSSAGLSHQKHP